MLCMLILALSGRFIFERPEITDVLCGHSAKHPSEHVRRKPPQRAEEGARHGDGCVIVTMMIPMMTMMPMIIIAKSVSRLTALQRITLDVRQRCFE